MTRFAATIDEEPLFAMIKEGIREKGLRPYARDLGVPIGVLRSVQTGRDTPYSSLKELSRALGLEFYIGPPRETGTIYTTRIDHEDFAAIPRVDARLAAGPGAENGDVSLDGALAFRQDWLRDRDIAPSQACLLRVSGDSMSPTLHDGDLVMIDERRTQIRNRHVYALIDIDGAARVKRVELVPDQLILLTSDNPAHTSDVRSGPDMNRLRILGEIVWSAHAW